MSFTALRPPRFFYYVLDICLLPGIILVLPVYFSSKSRVLIASEFLERISSFKIFSYCYDNALAFIEFILESIKLYFAFSYIGMQFFFSLNLSKFLRIFFTSS